MKYRTYGTVQTVHKIVQCTKVHGSKTTGTGKLLFTSVADPDPGSGAF
jgi:hypothetical protein